MSNEDRSSSARTARLHCAPCRVIRSGGGGGGGGDPATWSQFPATQTVNMDCHNLNRVESVTYCDGTYMGPGGSFDISSGQDIVVSTTGASKSVSIESGYTAAYPATNFGDGAKLEVAIDVSDGEIMLATQYPTIQRGTMIKMNKCVIDVEGNPPTSSQVVISADSIPLLETYNSALIQSEDRTVVMNSNDPIRLDFSKEIEPLIGPSRPAVLEYYSGEGKLQSNVSLLTVGNANTEGISISSECTIDSKGYPLTFNVNDQEIHLEGSSLVVGGTPVETGSYLRIKIGNNYYKLALLNDA